MTGGIGFSRQGQDSFKQNRDLINKRTMLKERLHTTPNQVQGNKMLASYEQLLRWRMIKDRNARKTNLLIFTLLFIVISVSLIILI
jgi:hypothetical protein